MYNFFNKLIDKLLKLPKAVVFIVLAASFIFANVFGYTQIISMTIPSVLSMFGIKYIWVSIILSGLAAWGLFEAITAIYFWIIKSMMGSTEIYKNKPDMVKILRWFFVIRNIIFGCLRLLYFRYPLAVLTMENILIFTVSLAMLVLYYFFIRKKYISPQQYPRSIIAFCAPYLIYMAMSMFTGGLL